MPANVTSILHYAFPMSPAGGGLRQRRAYAWGWMYQRNRFALHGAQSLQYPPPSRYNIGTPPPAEDIQAKNNKQRNFSKASVVRVFKPVKAQRKLRVT